jgi:hypothetical protein
MHRFRNTSHGVSSVSDIEETTQLVSTVQLRLLVRINVIAEQEIVRGGMTLPGVSGCRKRGGGRYHAQQKNDKNSYLFHLSPYQNGRLFFWGFGRLDFWFSIQARLPDAPLPRCN